jgi:hypothetical protein
MNSENERFDWIEGYLNGTLTDAQQAAFAVQLQTDPELAEEVQLHRTVQELVIDQALLDLKAKMLHEYRPKYSGKGPFGGGLGSTLLITGLVLLSATVGSMLYFQKQDSPVTTIPAVTPRIQAVNLTPVTPVIRTNPVAELQKSGTATLVVQPTVKNKVGEVQHIRQVTDSAAVPVNEHSATVLLPPLEVKLLDVKEVTTQVVDERKPVAPVNTPTHTPNESKPKEPVWDCASVKIAVKVNVQKSCSDFPTGKISFDRTTVEGGEPPYRFSLNNGLSFTKGSQFEHLSPGIYYLTVEDGRGCQHTLEEAFEVKLSACDAPQEYTFSPEQGETWKFPFAETQAGTLRIVNREGVLIYSIAVRNGFPTDWSGQGNQGIPVRMGSYRFTFEDGNGNRTSGSITLLK